MRVNVCGARPQFTISDGTETRLKTNVILDMRHEQHKTMPLFVLQSFVDILL